MSEWLKNKISVAILAGGKSGRTGYQKIFARVGNNSLIDMVYSRFSFFDDVFAVAREEIRGIRVIKDLFHAGVAGGIATALLDSKYPQVLVIGADMPFVSPRPLPHMVKIDADIVVPVWSNKNMEPLYALYSKQIRHSLIDFIYRGGKSISSFIKNSPHYEISIEEWISKGIFTFDFFTNLNTPEDFDRFKAFRG
ncbi:MAG: molybdenum cofactor guanylyltransferase [Candidatus Korarchaeota archaeon]